MPHYIIVYYMIPYYTILIGGFYFLDSLSQGVSEPMGGLWAGAAQSGALDAACSHHAADLPGTRFVEGFYTGSVGDAATHTLEETSINIDMDMENSRMI